MRERAPGLRSLNAKVRFALGPTDVIMLDATANPVTVGTEDGDADCTLRLSPDNLGKLMQGKLNPMIAFSLGKLKVDGSKGVAMKLASLLDA
ncbi:SCP2 sterol-binding domain-containing protein [bacterium]|nr:SCP2 sterol-binding domain-containing protein [bacterium]